MSRVLRQVIARSTWQRWAYLIVGGALMIPYWIVSTLLVGVVAGPIEGRPLMELLHGLLLLLAPVPMTFVTGLVPAVRVLESTAVRELVGGPLSGQPVSTSRTWRNAFRTGCWFTLHLHFGALMGALSLGVPALALLLGVFPFAGWDGGLGLLSYQSVRIGLSVTGLLLVAGLLLFIVLFGAGTAWLAPYFLGPSRAERLAELESRAERLAERNRLARELHDSVGHALSIVTLQAAAAGRVLDSDPDFARQALGAIEESARSALEDLDHVLGLLREDTAAATKAPQHTLADLDALLERTRMAGVTVDAVVGGALAGVPAAVSREAYRIVQECLTNALRHAGKVPVTLRIDVRGDRLEVELSNPLNGRPTPRGPGGGRGLRGIRERVTVLRGQMTAGPNGKSWRVGVSLPLRSIS